jgi:hypothetical protein
MISPTDPEFRRLAEEVVRHIARGTGFTTIALIGATGAMAFAVTESHLPTDITDPDYGRLLHTAADLERRFPTPLPVFACALVLPERDIAYLRDASTARASALTVGPHPYDDPDTRQTVEQGLAALMQAIVDTQPAHRPAGRPFTTWGQPQNAPRPLQPVPTWPPHQRPNGYRGRHR